MKLIKKKVEWGTMNIKQIPHSRDNNKSCPSKIIAQLREAMTDPTFQSKFDALVSLLHSRQIPLVIHERAQYVCLATENNSVKNIATTMRVCTRTVATWIGRFLDQGVEGLYDKPRSGRPLTFTPDVEAVLDKLLVFEPKTLAQEHNFSHLRDLLSNQTEWTPALIAEVFHVSQSTATKYLNKIKKLNGGSLSYCHSNDPNLPLKSILIDLLYKAGKYLGYDVFCFDEKPCIQAIFREFVLSPSCQVNRSDRYERRGITNVFGLLEFNTGKLELMTSDVKDTESIVAFLQGYFSQPERQGRKTIIIMDNISNHGCVQKILESELPVKICYTGTNSSWLNLIEAYFSKLQKQCIANKSFQDVQSLQNAIYDFQQKHNADIDSKKGSFSPAWQANVLEIMLNRIKLALYHALYVPKEFSILANGFGIGLAPHVESAIGSIARELYYSDNILHGIVVHPEFFTEDLVRLSQKLLDNPTTARCDIPVFSHALVSKREQCLQAEFDGHNLDFSSKVYEAYQSLDKAEALIQELIPLFNQPSRAKACYQPSLIKVKRAQEAYHDDLLILETLRHDLDEVLFVDEAKFTQLENKLAKQQKKVTASKSRFSKLKQDWEHAKEKAQPYLQGLKNLLLRQLTDSMKCCPRCVF